MTPFSKFVITYKLMEQISEAIRRRGDSRSRAGFTTRAARQKYSVEKYITSTSVPCRGR